jgi:protein-L-isoaspartate(D-aspartate) O-methyltransferase
MVEGAVRNDEACDAWHQAVEKWLSVAAIFDESLERGIADGFSKVPREHFFSATGYVEQHEDALVSIGEGEFLFRPTILMRMCALIEARKRKRVLVAGAGSGYLCAVLDAMGVQVFGVERIISMAQATRKNLDRLGHHAVWIQSGDAAKGWSDAAPFDAIVCCYPIEEAEELPLAELVDGGLIVAPLACVDGLRLALWEQGDGVLQRTVFERID